MLQALQISRLLYPVWSELSWRVKIKPISDTSRWKFSFSDLFVPIIAAIFRTDSSQSSCFSTAQTDVVLFLFTTSTMHLWTCIMEHSILVNSVDWLYSCIENRSTKTLSWRLLSIMFCRKSRQHKQMLTFWIYGIKFIWLTQSTTRL